jgi:hypothetical protein
MKNKLSDLNNHLFAQLERLSDESLTADQIEQEVKRGSAMTDIADKIIDNAALQLRAVGMMAEHGERVGRHLTMLESKP